MGGTIITVVEDLFFLAKIQQTAREIGIRTRPVGATSAAQDVKDAQPPAVVLDLNHRSVSALDLVRALKADPATRAIPILGFVSHVQTDRVNAARAAGCDLVLARSAFTQQLPDLLRKLASTASPAPSSRDQTGRE